MDQIYFVLTLWIGAVLAVFLAIYIGRRRTAPGVWPLVMLLLASAVWSVGYALELASEDLTTKILWAKVQYIGIVTIAPAWFVFAIQYTARRSWFTRSLRNLSLLTIVPIITLLFVWTNEAHGLVWSQTGLDTSTAFPMLQLEYGPWFWVYWVYAYLLLVLGSIWFASMLLQSARLYRWQVGVALLGMLVPWIANLLYVLGLTSANLDLTPFAFILAGLAYVLSLFRFHLLDIVPVARRAVVDGLSDCVIVCDLQNRILDVNPAAQRLAGKPGSDLIGRPATDLLGHHAGLVERCRDLQPAQTEISMKVANVEYHYDVRITPLLGEPHQLVGRLVVLHDVTDRRRAEEELRQARDGLELIVAERTAALEEANRQLTDELVGRQEAERRFRTLFEEAPVMYVITRSQDGTAIVADCNRLFLDTLGYRRDEVLARPLDGFYTPESRAKLEHTYLQTFDGALLLEERQLVTREGQVVETLLQAVPEFDTDGNAVGTRAMFTDMTQHKQAERKFRGLLESAPDAMVIVNEEGRIVLVNAQTERIFDYPRDELLDEHIQILLPLRSRDRHLEQLMRYFAEPRVRSMGIGLEVWAQRRDGTEFPVEIRLSPLKTEEGLQVSAAIRDISKRKLAEETLRESESKFRNIIESSPLGKHQYQLEPDGRLVFVEANPAADEILGVDHDQFVGETIEAVFPEIAGTELPEQFHRVAESGASWSTDYLLYESDEISGVFEIHAFQTSPGRMVAAFSDITERKQAEQTILRLAQQRQRLLQVSQSMLSTLALEEVMDQILLALQNLLTYDLCSIYLLDKEAGLLRPSKIAGQEYISETLDEWPIRLGQGIAGAVAQSGQGELVNDAHLDPRSLYPKGAVIAREHLISIPVQVQEKTIGVFNVGRIQAAPFTDEEFELVQLFTAQAAVAIHNAQLYTEVAQQREQLRTLARRLADAQEAERKDLARELHDQVGQSLTALDFTLNVMRSQLPDDSPASDQIRPQVDASMALLGQTAERIRDVMADLRPPVLDDYGLVAALDWYGSQFVAPRGITVTMGGQEPSPRLAPQVELALFRIAQEALTNVIKHAQATKATVHLETDPDQDTVRLVVVDDGTGFDPARQAGPADRQSWGLIGMVERAEAVGAHCRIESASGQGTQVVVEVTR